MIFREHLYWSMVSFSLGISVFSVALDYRNIGAWSYLVMACTFGLSAIFNEMGNVIDEKNEKIKRDLKIRDSNLPKNPDVKEHSGSRKYRLVAYLFLSAFCVYCFWIGTPASDHPLFIAAGYGGAFIGAFAPDLDKVPAEDMKYHRNPVSHSSIVTCSIATFALLTLPDYYISLDLFVIGIVLGNSSHLFADNFESKATLSQLFVDKARWGECPGDIRVIKEDKERAWINIHGAAGVFFTLLLYARFQLAQLMAYPLFWDGWEVVAAPLNTVSATIVSIFIAYVALSFVALHAWRDDKKKGKEKRDGDTGHQARQRVKKERPEKPDASDARESKKIKVSKVASA